MTKTSPVTHLVSGLLGGLVAVVVGAVLIATDVIDTGDTQTVSQQPVVRPNSNGDSEGPTVNEIYRRSGPGVAFVQAEVERRGESPFPFPEGDEGTATGSGFVLDDEGYVLTNAHVVEGARSVEVRLGQDDPIEADLVGTDPSTDIALLKVDPKETRLRPVALGDSSKVRVGDPAIAIGNPFGLDETVTTGIVSALQRQIQAPNGFQISDVIQTDASINPGNSGGPLLDGAGRVIGINSQIVTGGSRGSVGIGFAVPINTAKEVIPQLKENGKVDRAYLGITTMDADAVPDDIRLPAPAGALVQDVVDGGPADEAGLRAGRTQVRIGSEVIRVGGDLIVKVDGQDIRESQDVSDAIADNKPGDEITVEFFRGDERQTVRIELGKRPQRIPNGAGGPAPPGGAPDEEFPLP